MPDRSTVSNLFTANQVIQEGFNERMAKKLARLNREHFFFAIMNFAIMNRRYTLCIGGSPTGHSFSTQCAMPQGSHCGPVLFIIFTADFTWYLPPTVIILQYADDTKFLKQILDDDDRETLQKAIDVFVEWSDQNNLQLNQQKTYAVSYVKIANVSTIVDLELTMNNELTFKQHEDNVLEKNKNSNWSGASLFKRKKKQSSLDKNSENIAPICRIRISNLEPRTAITTVII